MLHLVYARTAKGTLEIRNRASALAPELRPVLTLIDGRATLPQLAAKLGLTDQPLQRALQQLQSAGYIEPAPDQGDDGDLDFTSATTMARLQAQAQARAAAEAAAVARAEQARRDAEAAQAREQERVRAHSEAQAQAERASHAREEADAWVRAADDEHERATVDMGSAPTLEAKEAAQVRVEAARTAQARAAAEARALAEAEARARAATAQTEAAAARARDEAQARARAESEAQARAHAEAHARAMVEAQLQATSAALAKAQALAREEAEARARLTADLQAREAGEVQARAEAATRARAEAEAQMRAELARLQAEAQRAREEAEARAEAERLAREVAEELAQQERAARAAAEAQAFAERAGREEAVRLAAEEAEARARAEAEQLLDAQRRAHAAARAATQALIDEERAAREAAESRAETEAQARLAYRSETEARADEIVRDRVAHELAAREAAERAADAQYRAEAVQRARSAGRQRPAQPDPVQIHRPRNLTLRLKVGAGGLFALVVTAVLVLPLVPLDHYLPRAEKMAAAALTQPVRIARMQYRMVPTPELVLEGVAVGRTYTSRVERVSIAAWPWELFRSGNTFDTIAVHGAVLEDEGLAGIRGLLDTGRRQGAVAGQVLFSGSRIALHGMDIPVSQAHIRYDGGGRIQAMSITSSGATLEASPVARGAWNIRIDARNWVPPLGPPVPFESFTLRGVMDDGRIRNAQVDASIAGAELKASLKADWHSAVRAEGEFELTKAELEPLMQAYTRHFSAKGSLYARGQYALEGATMRDLMQAPRVVAEFRITRGELGNVDVVRALQQLSARGVRGGRTRFEQLTGRAEVSADGYRYRQLRLTSGPLTASGEIALARNQLSGRVSAELASSSRPSITGVLGVRGTLSNPVLHR